MTRFLFVLFVLCLIATGGVWYWKTQHPAGDVMEELAAPSTASRSADGTAGGAVTNSAPTSKSLAKEARRALRKASRAQDLASMVSLICSILSGAGAVASAYFSYLRYRHQKRTAMRG